MGTDTVVVKFEIQIPLSGYQLLRHVPERSDAHSTRQRVFVVLFVQVRMPFWENDVISVSFDSEKHVPATSSASSAAADLVPNLV